MTNIFYKTNERKSCYFLNQPMDFRILQIIRPIELEIMQIDHVAFLNFNQTLLFCQNLFVPYQLAIFFFILCAH